MKKLFLSPLILLATIASLYAQVQPINWTPASDTLLSNKWYMATGTNSPTNAKPYIAFKLGYPISVTANVTTQNTTNALAGPTFLFDFSQDNTTWTTGSPLRLYTPAMNGTTAVVPYTNYSGTLLDNMRYMRLTSVQLAGTNECTITNVTVWYKY